jgi:hypothetical protein
MEKSLMPKPAVAGILNKHFIESRLHTDHPDEVTRERNKELQKELQGDPSLPYYMLIDPESGKVYGTFGGMALQIDSFIEFLEDAVEESGIEEVASAK